MVRPGDAFGRHNVASKRPEAALHSVANDRAADLFGDGKADSNCGIAIAAVADEQDEAGGCGALPGVCGEEIATLAKGN